MFFYSFVLCTRWQQYDLRFWWVTALWENKHDKWLNGAKRQFRTHKSFWNGFIYVGLKDFLPTPCLSWSWKNDWIVLSDCTHIFSKVSLNPTGCYFPKHVINYFVFICPQEDLLPPSYFPKIKLSLFSVQMREFGPAKVVFAQVETWRILCACATTSPTLPFSCKWFPWRYEILACLLISLY